MSERLIPVRGISFYCSGGGNRAAHKRRDIGTFQDWREADRAEIDPLLGQRLITLATLTVSSWEEWQQTDRRKRVQFINSHSRRESKRRGEPDQQRYRGSGMRWNSRGRFTLFLECPKCGRNVQIGEHRITEILGGLNKITDRERQKQAVQAVSDLKNLEAYQSTPKARRGG